MSNFVPFNRDQSFLLTPVLKAWLPADDIAHFIVATMERASMTAFQVPGRPGGKPQYHHRLMLPLLFYCYANGTALSRRIEWATYRDIGVRFVAVNLHQDHDKVAVFRRTNTSAIEAAFLQILLLARESGLLSLGTVSIDGANLVADVAALTAQAEAADADDQDPQALPKALARRETLNAKLDAACARLEAKARAGAEAARPEYDTKKAAYDAKTGWRGRPPHPPEDPPPPKRQSNLTDPDSALMHRSDAHEYRQAYNAQAVVCAEGSQLILATNLVATTADAPSVTATVLGMKQTIGLPRTVLADTGFASGPVVAALQAAEIERLVAIGRTQLHWPYDFRPPPTAKTARNITEPWRVEMKARLETKEGKNQYKQRKQSVEPVFGIIKAAIGFVRFHIRGLCNVANEWRLIALVCNCRRLTRLRAA